MSDSKPEATGYPLTFEAVLLMDEIRRENHCAGAICAYQEDCVCWGELLEETRRNALISGKHHTD